MLLVRLTLAAENFTGDLLLSAGADAASSIDAVAVLAVPDEVDCGHDILI